MNPIESAAISAASDVDLAEIVIGNRGKAERLFSEATSPRSLLSCVSEGFEFYGLTGHESRRLSAALEIGRRAVQSPLPENAIFNRSDLVAEYFASIAAGLEVEKFWVLCLNRKNRLLKQVEITSGTANAALAHPREVFRAAIRAGASAVICVHNHPSGDPVPSAADMRATRQLREAAKTVDVELLDHVIIGRASADPSGLGYFSFREAGHL